jgi:hypothetical protein
VSGRTWLMMLVILGLNWGGFLVTLVYGLRREKGEIGG